MLPELSTEARLEFSLAGVAAAAVEVTNISCSIGANILCTWSTPREQCATVWSAHFSSCVNTPGNMITAADEVTVVVRLTLLDHTAAVDGSELRIDGDLIVSLGQDQPGITRVSFNAVPVTVAIPYFTPTVDVLNPPVHTMHVAEFYLVFTHA